MTHVSFARILFAAFFALLAGLLAALRRLRSVVDSERVDAFLRDEMRDDLRDGGHDADLRGDRRTP